MENLGIRGSNLSFAILVLLLVKAISGADIGGNDESVGRCNLDLSSFIPLPYSDTSNMVCKSVWNTYVLQYSQTEDHVVTILLSAIYTTGWVGIAFSKNGMMLNSSAIVGWISREGQVNIKQYYLKGFEQLDVVPNKGDLPLTDIPPFVALHGATIYIAFQLKFSSQLGRRPILLAFGTRYPTKHHHLYEHDDKASVVLDFFSGSRSSASISVAPGNIGALKENHGILGLLGWGLFLPYGAIAARYFRHHEPLWYYLHVGIQFVGFLLGLAGLVLGLSLYSRIHADFPTHKGIGIFVFVTSILQILAFFARPSKDNKMRKYWNWYHHWLGRIALVFGNVNILIGIKIGYAGIQWKIGYGILLSSILFASIVLEVLLRIKWSQKLDVPPTFQMNPFQ